MDIARFLLKEVNTRSSANCVVFAFKRETTYGRTQSPIKALKRNNLLFKCN